MTYPGAAQRGSLLRAHRSTIAGAMTTGKGRWITAVRRRLPGRLDLPEMDREAAFYGAHNPPYGLKTMIFYASSPDGVQLVRFGHQDEPH